MQGKGMDQLPDRLKKLNALGDRIRPNPKIRYKTFDPTLGRTHRMEGSYGSFQKLHHDALSTIFY